MRNMKKVWKKRWHEIIISLAVAAAVLAADIASRPYFAVGGGGLLMVCVITYWVVAFVEGGEEK